MEISDIDRSFELLSLERVGGDSYSFFLVITFIKNAFFVVSVNL